MSEQHPPIPAPPVVPLPMADRLPAELLACQSWITWRAEWAWHEAKQKWKLNKVPCVPETGNNCSFNGNHSTFREATTRVSQLRKEKGTHFGLGVAFSGAKDFFCLDLDDELDAGISNRLAWIAQNFPTWAETSLSGTGVHLFYRGTASGKEVLSWRGRKIELFGSTGFIAVTGNCTDPGVPPMADGTELLGIIHAERETEPKKAEPQTDKQYTPRNDGELSPGDDFDVRGSWREVLEPHGWTLAKGSWESGEATRPGKGGGVSATVGVCRGKRNEPLLHVFSINAEPFREHETCGKFNAFTLLNYGRDKQSDAARELGSKGYGTRSDGFKQRMTVTTNGSTKQAEPSGEQSADVPPPILTPVSVRELVRLHPHMRPARIDGILRDGETCNIIAGSKIGKSWLAKSLALHVATGKSWMNHECQAGRVLYVDNELHAETFSSRIRKVGGNDGYGIPFEDYADKIDVLSLRGRLQDLYGIGRYFETIKEGDYALIVLDAFYRFLPVECDENSNGDVMRLYNYIDSHAMRLNCCYVQIHHSSKGEQGNKAVTDVGAGAGSQSRAPDTHLVIRPHVEKGLFVAEAATRSFPPMEPVVLRWEYPRWSVDHEADPTQLAGKTAKASPEDKERKKAEQQANDEKEARERRDLDCEAALAKLKQLKKATMTKWRTELAFSGTRIGVVAETLLAKGEIQTAFIKINGKGYDGYTPAKKAKTKHPDNPDSPDRNDDSCPGESASGSPGQKHPDSTPPLRGRASVRVDGRMEETE